MYFREYLGRRPIEDVFLPGDAELYRPIIARVRNSLYMRSRVSDLQEEYDELMELVARTCQHNILRNVAKDPSCGPLYVNDIEYVCMRGTCAKCTTVVRWKEQVPQ